MRIETRPAVPAFVRLAARGMVAAVCALSLGCGAAAPPRALDAKTPSIAWQPWGTAAFARAAGEGKVVVVDVGIEGCTACRTMHEETYRDPAVIEWIARHAVAVSVDADMQPDVAERFDPWGWPATGILAPDGRALWMVRGYRLPGRFLGILQEVAGDHRAGKPSEAVEDEPSGPASDLQAACVTATRWLDERGDDSGWGGDARVANDSPIRLSLLRAHAFAETDRLERARAQARGTAALNDPEWGGVFVTSTSPDWRGYIPEKRTISQAHALASFGVGLSMDPTGPLLDGAHAVDRYLRATMRRPDGTYASTQRDQVLGLPPGMTARDYYALRAEERTRYGRPVVDHAAYTAENGLLALGYLEVHRATGDALWLTRARELVDALLATRMTADGHLRQAVLSADVGRDPRLRAPTGDARTALYLRPQVQVGVALVELFEATADERYLQSAERLAAAIERLRSPDGGYFSGEPRATDGLLARRAPAYDNAWAARLFTALFGVTGESRYRQRAGQILESIHGIEAAARSEGLDGVAVYALALHEHLLGPVSVVVVGPAGDPRTRALIEAGYRNPDSRVFAYRDVKGRYAAGREPLAYVCTLQTCTLPLASTKQVENALATDLRGESRAPCALDRR